ncbi:MULTISPECIES: DUF3017 domain-containing protein [Streptomycetaceae]|uniref:DUF3017 domain-containing protein n=1 Tax=Streptomycetaceae TaxID=2062 RepID=UPI000CDBED9D|nr:MULTISPECIES: DUF3017 domain-containing protein [Streptomycetaceae]AUY51391.1 hypothetical protein C2142_23430 [Streptomyces sp. CB01881]MBP0454930.1 DUF3017 domain-containing protein [Kitasatospora sp. RG8]TYC74780.1 DUF3017 domain-containing protein [Streptomyces sp. CB01881]
MSERPVRSRRRPVKTTGTLPPEGSAAALGREHALPVRQWPITLVLLVVGAGLAVTWFADFKEGFKYGLLILGGGVLLGAVLRLVLPEVGMLAVRSRFTDVIVLSFLGLSIVLLTLVAQPNPWLEIRLLDNIGNLIGRPRH